MPTKSKPTYEELEKRISILEDDVIKGRKAQEDIKREAVLRRALFENSPDGILIIDPKTSRFLEFNTAAHKQLGYSREDFSTLCIFDIEAKETTEDTRANIADVIQKGRSDFETLQRTRGGEIRNVHVSAQVVNVQGNPVYYCVWKDITEHKRAEEALRKSEAALRSVFKAAPLGLSILKDGVFQDINESWIRSLGYSPSDVIGNSPRILFESEATFQKARQEIFASISERGIGSVQTTHRKKNGEVRDVIVTAVPLQLSDYPGMEVVATQDITDRKRLEAELRQREERYRLLFEEAIQGMFRNSLDGAPVLLNPAMARMLGYDSVQAVLERVKDIGAQIYADPVERRAVIDRVTQDGAIKDVEVFFKRADGSLVKVMLNTRLVRDKDGTPVFLEGSCIDITEKWLAEKALKASEEKYRKIFEDATEGIFQTSLEGRYLSINPAIVRMFGYVSAQEMIDSIKNMVQELCVSPEDGKQLLRILRKQDKIDSYEIEVYRKDRSRFWISMNIHTVRDASGNILYFEGTNIDITERKRAEERSRLSEEKLYKVFMMSPEIIAITRIKDGLIVDVNQGFEEITGWKRHDALGRSSFEIKFWVDTAERDWMVKELRSGKDVLHREFQFRRNDGTVRSGIYSTRSITIAGEACLIFVMQDTTERKQLEKDHQELEERLIQSQKMGAIGTLAGGIAHDFNNLLAVIQGYIELLKRDLPADNKAAGKLFAVEKVVGQATELTNRLITFSKGGEPVKRVTAIGDIAKDAVLDSIGESSLQKQFSIDPDLQLVEVDEGQIRQVVRNLTINAVEAMPDGGSLVVRVRNKTVKAQDRLPVKEGAYVWISVEDTGKGIPLDELPLIFDPYFSTKQRGADKGMGLGLSVCHAIVGKHDGYITCESQVGERQQVSNLSPGCCRYNGSGESNAFDSIIRR